MSTRAYLQGDSEPITMALEQDQVVEALERAEADGQTWLRLDTPAVTVTVRVSAVVMVGP